MFSFRKKIVLTYAAVFLLFIALLLPYASHFVNHVVVKAMENRTTELIERIKDAPDNENLIKRLKEQKATIFFRVAIITNEHKIIYDSQAKSLLGPSFSQEYIVSHPEVDQAFKYGKGYISAYSNLFGQEFSYFAKSFDFHGKTYVLRTAFPYEFIEELTRNVEFGFLGAASVILLLFSLLTWSIINHLTQPIDQIIQAIRPYQEGTTSVLPEIQLYNTNSDDDFGKLAKTLNSLSKKIRYQIDTLTSERNEKEAVLESLIEGVIAVDKDMIIAYANQTALKFVKKPLDELIGHPFNVIDLPHCQTLLESCQLEEIPLTGELQLHVGDKKMFLDIVATPKKDQSGAVLVLQDKTSHYKIIEMRKEFIANASHELKTPITIIRGFAETLHDNPTLPIDTTVEITNKIVSNCNRMTMLIKDLLTLADIENIPSSRLVECDLNVMVNSCRMHLQNAFPEAIIEILKPENENVTVVADSSLIDLALTNLMENAIKYSTKPAEVMVSISLAGSDKVELTIEDKGIGIPEGDLEHIFDRFYTVNKAHSRKMGGSGLGLSIVKTIIEKHGGKITVESEIGKGTKFTIMLPISRERLSEEI